MAFDSSQQALVICAVLSVISSLIILCTFSLSKAWAKEMFDRKHLLICMTITLICWSTAVSFVNLHKSEIACVIQANFIQIFGVATVMYAAAVAVDAYFYIMGFSVPSKKANTVLRDGALSAIPSADRSSNVQIESVMSDAALDFYNRDTETDDSNAPEAIIGLDIQVVASSVDRSISLEAFRQSNAFGVGGGHDSIGDKSYMASSSIAKTTTQNSSCFGFMRAHWRPIARKYKILHICIFSYILLGLFIFNTFDVAVTYISPGYICYFYEVTFIGYFTIIPIFGSVITIFISNFGIIRVVLKFYRSGAGENENDVVDNSTTLERWIAAFNVHAYVKAILEVLRRLDKTGSKELTRVILFPLFYLIAAMMIVVIGIIRRVFDHKSPTSLVVAVCNGILVGVGNCLIWVLSDSDIIQLWVTFLSGYFGDCCAYMACCICGGTIVGSTDASADEESVTTHQSPMTREGAGVNKFNEEDGGVMMVPPGTESSSEV